MRPQCFHTVRPGSMCQSAELYKPSLAWLPVSVLCKPSGGKTRPDSTRGTGLTWHQGRQGGEICTFVNISNKYVHFDTNVLYVVFTPYIVHSLISFPSYFFSGPCLPPAESHESHVPTPAWSGLVPQNICSVSPLVLSEQKSGWV